MNGPICVCVCGNEYLCVCVYVPIYLFVARIYSNFTILSMSISITTSPSLYICVIIIYFTSSSLHCSYILRMKEYERERRLMVRRERIAQKKATEVLTA